ncbi:DUF5605 domain-containing protein [Streptomyces sp. NPDC088812]|uniref:DUF5605 domain-containing protein n=1 Tax=Streptomyces sp. NPDC088812 TaxID=3365905 RepID=UPI0037FC72C6
MVYLGLGCSTFRWIQLPQDSRWKVDVIDTWNMTVETQPGVAEGRVRVNLPGRAYMAVRLRRVTARADG